MTWVVVVAFAKRAVTAENSHARVPTANVRGATLAAAAAAAAEARPLVLIAWWPMCAVTLSGLFVLSACHQRPSQ